MLSGTGVVATRHAAIADIIDDGRTGYIVDERSVDAISAAMSRIIENPSTTSAIGMAGKHAILQSYTADHSLTTIRGVLESVVS